MTKKEKQQLEEKARAFLLNARLTNPQIQGLEKLGYFTAPASMRHHLNCAGGLMQHSINVTNNLLGFDVFKDRASAFRVGMLHDLVKCLCYKPSKSGASYVYSQPPYPGHGVCSALIAADLGIELNQAERAAIVWHMGAFGLDEDQLKEYHAALQAYPRELILTHACDHLASAFEGKE